MCKSVVGNRTPVDLIPSKCQIQRSTAKSMQRNAPLVICIHGPFDGLSKSRCMAFYMLPRTVSKVMAAEIPNMICSMRLHRFTTFPQSWYYSNSKEPSSSAVAVMCMRTQSKNRMVAYMMEDSPKTPETYSMALQILHHISGSNCEPDRGLQITKCYTSVSREGRGCRHTFGRGFGRKADG